MAEELILRLKKKRAVNRSYLTKTCNKIESGLDTLMRIELEELLEQLNESFNELKLVDHEIETLLETDDLEKELQGVEEYREKYITWRFRANKKIRQSDFHGENIPNNSNSRIDENEMRHYVPSCTTVKLPKWMISKFYGNFSEWLTFWNSFDAAIHQNNSLNPIDKFNYLKSHLGGTALNTVEGFALSADNYEKAIKLLKDRFGREDILISRHMNNLLSMRPLKTSSDVRTFRELFDNLSVHIRSLESLNVSIDVYGQLLCPIIIKLLPADLNLELNKELPTGYVINDLITFLERQLTAREKSFRNEIGTGNESTSKPNLVNKHPKTRFYNEKPIATASELLNSVHKSNECVFCGKDNHGSPKCDFAANISLNEKRSLMKKKGVCYKCLRPSHLSKFCRNVVRCSICNMSSHLDVMCTKRILDRGGSSKSPTVQDETLANLSTSPDVLLPTLRVTLKGNRTEKTARAIIDTGSQRSYILHSTAMEMEYEQSRREFFRHSLFGGSSTDIVEHEVYTIHLSDINNSYRCEFEALGQPLICGSIPPVWCPRSFLEGSEELDVSDLMRDRTEVLIGADIAGRLLTDDQRRISSGLVAIRTKLGWTVMGKIPPTEVRDDTSSLCVTTLLSLDLENLWKLDAIGVSDAEVEKKTQSLQAEMEEHFAHTTTRDIEGRYEVALPWVQDKERIPSNKDLAENQLSSVRRKLEEVGDMNEYGQIFEDWMNQGIIEYAREDKLDGVHYLPHRPVYKRNSQTSRIRPVFNASARKRDKLSLNDCLDKGPNLIEIIPRLLNKFRKYEVGVSSDIEKAFLQIGTKEDDRDAAVFEIAGVELTGHLILKNKKKAWIVIFTCAVYRGVHLELVTSLSMEAFLQAFRRFIARRGRPLIVYSDNGTNFKGMANALKKIDFSRLKCDPTLKNITWKFIPPGAPWWGGWWERLIGRMKQLLFRILGQTSLGYEELSTVMCDVESLMNTRPLTYLTEESEDLAPLTPSLFLHEVREVGVPDLDLIDNQTLSRKYQYIKRVREDLRERFRIEYFGFLRQETRRLKATIPLKVGDMVLIGQESLKRLHWSLARIIQLYPGKDGLVRVAKVKTSSGDKIRPIQKLYNLEISPEIRCRDPLTERSPTQEVRLTTEEDPLTSQQEQHHIDTPNVVSSYGRPIKRPNRLDLLNFSFPCLSRRDANSKEEVDEEKELENYEITQEKIEKLKIRLMRALEGMQSTADTKQAKGLETVKLPKFELPHFYGDANSLFNFKEVFKITIDQNQGLNDLQKLQYLGSAVKGEASRLIRGFPIVPESYKQAWDTLVSRYDNKRELAYAQLNKIFKIKQIKNPSAKALRELLDTCNESVRNLESLGLKRNELVDVILVQFLKNTLDEEMKRHWELAQDERSFPSYENFILFLERQSRSLPQGSREYQRKENETQKDYANVHTAINTNAQICIICKAEVTKTQKDAKPQIFTPVSEINNTSVEQGSETINQVLLATAQIIVEGENGSPLICRALLDSGSQVSLITKESCEKLGLKGETSGRSLRGKPSLLGQSREKALARFLALERRLLKTPRVYKQYKEFMREYEALGHMELVPIKEIIRDPSTCYYMPHHGVEREQSATTKLRVVFDASAKTDSGTSLNQILETGPKIQRDIFVILTGFRAHPIAIIADIEKMFRQVRIHPEGADYQRILWRQTPEQPVQDYRLLTVTYGTTSAPFLAIRTMQQLARDECEEFPTASRVVMSGFYVDDLLTGVSSKQEGEELIKQMIGLMSKGGFEIRKWKSNCHELVSQMDETETELSVGASSRVLGILWDNSRDAFRININNPGEVITKRDYLSNIARIFDPLGFLSPLTVALKIMMQELWKEKLSWDEPMSERWRTRWNSFRDEMSVLTELEIPRYILMDQNSRNIQLHGFCDASSVAYSAVCYLKSETIEGQVGISPIAAKTRVAPCKPCTLLRLELCAALLLSRLYRSIVESIKLPLDEVHLWTDSQIALCWIKSDPNRWKKFISHRVMKIQQFTELKYWGHVSGKDNPADCASRGLKPAALIKHELWWQGPSWLKDDCVERIWKNSNSDLQIQRQEEVVAFCHLKTTSVPEYFLRYSSFTRLKRVTAWCLRFGANCQRASKEGEYGPLTTAEMNRAIMMIVKLAQCSEFLHEIQSLNDHIQLPNKNRILDLEPFLDNEGLLRVGGRLQRSNLSSNQKHPMILPKKQHITRTPRRIIFTKEINETLEELKGVSPDECLLMEKREFIVQYYQQIKEFDGKIEMEMIGAEEYDEKAVMKELESTEHYEKMYSAVLIRINKILEAKTEEKRAMSEAGSEGSRRALLRLPKMELPCFDGDLEGWISWWSRFKRIHEDKDLDDDEKMHYLVQAMIPGSRAHRLLGAYTHTGKNYENAIGALKGSQYSFIKESLAEELGLEKLGERKLTKCLFGGRQTREEKHSLYSFSITNILKEETVQLKAMGQRMICDRVPILTAGTWMRDLDKKGVTIIRKKN
ncbi:hypothetical protein LAZ67_10000024, partial [Cordylochernes scorpioides]